MIDVHTHALFGVDDGPDNIELSLEILKDAAGQGVSDMILTPHYRHHMFKYDTALVEKNFEILKASVQEAGIPIRLYLGCEYHVNEKILDYLASGRTKSLAGSHYVLTEYKFETSFDEIYEQTKRLLSCSYRPVIAHVERYECLLKKPKLCAKLQELGALIQCNADAILGRDGRLADKMLAKLLKHEWVDMIASDVHNMDERANHLRQAYDYISKKYDHEYAEWLFTESPGRILH